MMLGRVEEPLLEAVVREPHARVVGTECHDARAGERSDIDDGVHLAQVRVRVRARVRVMARARASARVGARIRDRVRVTSPSPSAYTRASARVRRPSASVLST